VERTASSAVTATKLIPRRIQLIPEYVDKELRNRIAGGRGRAADKSEPFPDCVGLIDTGVVREIIRQFGKRLDGCSG
jgi:hypothetical protein